MFNSGLTQPEDRGIVLADIIESDPVSPTLMSEKFCSAGRDQNNDRRLRAKSDKCPTLTARYYKGVKSDGAPFVYSGGKEKGDLFDYNTDLDYRKLTPRECFRLQTMPEHYIDTRNNVYFPLRKSMFLLRRKKNNVYF